MTLDAGVRLGPYEILSPLALAGVGEVYRGIDHERTRDVAVRVLRVDFAARPALRQRFEDDMRAAAALRHPNILDVHDVGTDAGAAYIVSEPCEGETLRGLLDRGTMPAHVGVRCLAQVARALAAARRQGIAHRDLRPENVLVAPGGRVAVLGFGMGGLAQPGTSDLVALAGLARHVLLGSHEGDALRRRRRGTAWMAAAGLVVLVAALVVPRSRTSPPAGTPLVTSTPDAAAGDAAPSMPAAGPLPSAAPAPAAPDSDTAPDSLEAMTVPTGPGAAARGVVAPPTSAAGPVGGTAPPGAVPVSAGPSAAAPAVTAAEPAPPTPAAARDDRDVAALITEASVRSTEFDFTGASNLLRTAADRGDVSAQVAALYVRGLLDARESFRRGGAPDTLAPVRDAMGSLEAIAKGRPGSAEIARLMLHAAAAAAQSEREEMRLYLDTAVRMESLQRAGGLPGAPLVSAAEVAGDLWLQVHRYEDARQAYAEAAERVGSTLRILAGQARAARGLNDVAGACVAYRGLFAAWGVRPGLPVEIAEARVYIAGFCAPGGP